MRIKFPYNLSFIALGRVGWWLVRLYQLAISPFFPRTCRFTPTCSAYAAEAFLRFGLFKGTWLSMRRLLRCHPFGRHGFDPPPDK